MHHLHRLKEKIMSGDSKSKDIQFDKSQSNLIADQYSRQDQGNPYEKGYYSARNQSQPLSDISNTMCQGMEEEYTSFQRQRLPVTLMNALPREQLEAYLKDANKRLCKKLRYKGCLTQEDVYIIKLKWLFGMLKAQRKQHKRDLSGFRQNLEKAIEEASLTLESSPFQNRTKIGRYHKRMNHFLTKLEPQKAILLSYKLFKMHLKQLNLDNNETKLEVASKCHNFFIPYTKLMEIDLRSKEKKQKKVLNLVTYQKIKKFLQKGEIAHVLLQYHDKKSSKEFLQKFEKFLNEKVSLQNAMQSMTCKTQGMIDSEPCQKLVETDITKRTQDDTRQTFEDLDEILDDRPHLENARTIELDENNDIITMDRQGPYFVEKTNDKEAHLKTEEKPLIKEKKKLNENLFKEVMNKNAPFDDDSSDECLDHSLSENETDNELMEDPELYVQKKHEFYPISPEYKHATRTASRFKCESGTTQTSQTIQGSEKLRPLYEKKNSGNLQTSDDLHLKTDPMRVTAKHDLIRVNSSSSLAALERQAKKQECELDLEQPPERSYRKKPSLVHRQLTVTKTKEEIVFQKVLSIANDETSNWATIVNTATIKVKKIKPEGSPVILLKAWAHIEGFNPQEVFNQIYDTEKRAKWDTVTVGLRVVEPLTETSAVIYFYVKTPFGITERDFVQRRNFAMDYPEKGCVTMSFESCTHPGAPVMKKRIRAETHIAGYLVKPSTMKPNSTELIILSQVDIKGNIPKSIVNMVAGKAPAEWVEKLKKACERGRMMSKN